MRNVIYKVSFDLNPLLDGEFDFKEEALDWANEHLAEKPIVKALDIEYSDEFGGEPIVHEEEEIFHYPVEDVEDEFNPDELAARLADLENEIDADPEGAKLHRDFPEFESLNERVQKSSKDVKDTMDDFINSLDDTKIVNKRPVVTNKKVANTLSDFANNLGEEVKEDLNSDIDSIAAQWESVEQPKEEKLEEDVILFDPFGCDFSECEPMEVCKDNHRADCCDDICQSPADWLRELAAELGIADEVEISEKECADGSCEEKHEDEISCETCKDEISEISDEVKVEEPVVVEDEVKVDVAPEAEVAAEEDIVPEEVKANEEPNVEVQVEDEKPAEETPAINISVDTANLDADKVEEVASAITDAVEDVEKPEGTTVAFGVGVLDDQVEEPVEEAVCPECGKEICEDVEITKQQYDKLFAPLWRESSQAEWKHTFGDLLKIKNNKYFWVGEKEALDSALKYLEPLDLSKEPELDSENMKAIKALLDEAKHKCGKEICECGNKELVEKNKVTHTMGDPAIGDAHFNGAFEGGEGVSENLEENKVLTDYVQCEMAKGKSAEEVAETDKFKELAKEEGKKDLVEEVHPQEAQPVVDLKKAFNNALAIAKRLNKKVIYGYEGADHHGGKRYFELEPIICDDLAKCTADVMKRYHPSGAVMVAYPDKDFAEELDCPNCDKEDKMLFIEEDEMSDEEFAEALKKGLEEKHCKENLVEEDSADPNEWVEFELESPDGQSSATVAASPDGDGMSINFKDFDVEVGEEWGEGDGWQSTETLNGDYEEYTPSNRAFINELVDNWKYICKQKKGLDEVIGLDKATGKFDIEKFKQAMANDDYLYYFIIAWATIIGVEQARDRADK